MSICVSVFCKIFLIQQYMFDIMVVKCIVVKTFYCILKCTCVVFVILWTLCFERFLSFLDLGRLADGVAKTVQMLFVLFVESLPVLQKERRYKILLRGLI